MSDTERKISRRDFLKVLGLGAAGGALAAVGGFKLAEYVSKTPTEEAGTPKPTREAATPTEEAEIPQGTEQEKVTEKLDLPYFSVEGAPSQVVILFSDPRVANNGLDAAGNDHKNPFMPRSAAWLVTADPGHYRVDNLANVTDPNVRASIERDIRNGAAFAGDDYKDVLLGDKTTVPLWESGGGAIITGAQMQLELKDAQGNPIVFQLGRQENHGWIVVIANGLERDHVRGTDANRSLELSQYDVGFTMWQGIPPGMFISAQYVCQTIADAHKAYRDRGTSPGQGHDGVERVSILVAKILPEGVAYTVLQHNNPDKKWENYNPDQFTILNNNTDITE